MLGPTSPESRFETIDKIPIGVFALDPSYRILFWNECLENWTGIKRSELLGTDIRERFPKICKPGFARRIETVFRAGVPTVFSPQLHAPFIECEISPGVLRVQYITVTSLRADDGQGFLAVFSIQDITDLTRRLDESRRTAKELDSELKRRTELEQDLRNARDAADSASRSKSEFLARMSHEIRTPMNGIIGMNHLLLNTGLDQRQRRYAEVVGQSANSLLAILDDILDWSKIEAGKLALESVDFNLHDVVEGVADLMAIKAQEKQLELLCLVEPGTPARLRGDPVRLRQVLTNLVGNAVKFTAAGEVIIRVRRESSDGPLRLRFEVRDTGIGVPPEKQSLLFQPFSQADASTTRRFGGTGLGLSIVRRLVEMMGGKAGVLTGEGKGSTFWFTAGFERSDERESLELPAWSGRRILVADPNRANRELVSELLASWECPSETFADLDAAAARLLDASSDPPDAVLLAVPTPRSHDPLPKEAIHEAAASAGIPVVLMARFDQMGISRSHSGSSYAASVTKPVKATELRCCLGDVFRSSGEPEVRTRRAVVEPEFAAESRKDAQLLVVEDNPTNQEVAIGILQELGYRNMEIVASGTEALEALGARPFDLVLMDCQLPDMDGYEACRRIRDAATPVRNHEVPVVAMTAQALAGDREHCLAAGMNDYVAKPIRPELLGKVLETWLPATGRQAEPVPAPPTPQRPATAVFDSEGVLERLMGNEDLARRVIGRFLADMPEQLVALNRALQQADSAAAHLTAHTIKGAAANVGGVQLSEVAFQVETLGKSGDLAAIQQMIPELNGQWEQYRDAVSGFLESE